jgi:hypothetical protein
VATPSIYHLLRDEDVEALALEQLVREEGSP